MAENPFPKELYIVKDGKNVMDKEWSIWNSGSASGRYFFDFYGVWRLQILVGNRQKYYATFTSTTPVFDDLSKYQKLNITFTNKSGGENRDCYLKLGSKSFKLTSATVSSAYTQSFDISDVTGSAKLQVEYHNYYAVSGSYEYWSFDIKDIWLSWDIAPYSTISSISTNVRTSESITASLIRSSDSYWHQFCIYDGDDLIACEEGAYDSVSVLASQDWADRHPDVNTFDVTAVLRTYTDNTLAEELGSTEPVTITVTCDQSIKPSILSVTLEPVLLSQPSSPVSGFVQSLSVLKASIDVGGNLHEAGISKYKLTVLGKEKEVLIPDGQKIFSIEIRSDTLTEYGSINVSVMVTDTRGATDVWTGSFDVMPYSAPTINVTNCFRSDSTGSPDDESNYINVGIAPIYSSLNGQNFVLSSATVNGTTYQIDPSGTVIGGTLSPDTTYFVTFRVIDVFGFTASSIVKVPTRVWAMQFMPDGVGAAFGKAAEHSKTLQIPDDWSFRIGNTLMSESDLTKAKESLPSSGGTIDGDLSVTGQIVGNNVSVSGSFHANSKISVTHEGDTANSSLVAKHITSDVEIDMPDSSGTLALVSDTRVKLVWENTTPTSMAAQTITFSSEVSQIMNQYTLFAVIFRIDASVVIDYSTFALKGRRSRMVAPGTAGTITYYRGFTLNQNNLVLEAGSRTDKSDASVCVPIAIYALG